MLNAENLKANIQIALRDVLDTAKSVNGKLRAIWVKSDADGSGTQRLSDFLNDIPVVKQKIPTEKLKALMLSYEFSGVAIVVFFRKVAASDKPSFDDTELNAMIDDAKKQGKSGEANSTLEGPQVIMSESSSSSNNFSNSSSSSSSSVAAAQALVSLSAKRKLEDSGEDAPRPKIPRRDHQGLDTLAAERAVLEGLQAQLKKDQAALAAQQAAFQQAQAQLASDQARLHHERGEMAVREALIRTVLVQLNQQIAESNGLRAEINAARTSVEAACRQVEDRIREAADVEARAAAVQQGAKEAEAKARIEKQAAARQLREVKTASEALLLQQATHGTAIAQYHERLATLSFAEAELRRGQEQLETRLSALLVTKREAVELSAQANVTLENATREQGLASVRIQAARELEQRALAAEVAAEAAEASLRAARAELEAKTASDREYEQAWRGRLAADLDAQCRAFEAQRKREERQQKFAQASWAPDLLLEVEHPVSANSFALMASPRVLVGQEPTELANNPDNPFGLG